MPLITSFDPWRSGLCTCPIKLTFNPYTGCDHKCVYCYASSYIRNFTDCHPKKDIYEALKREATKLNGEIISISNSSDPYPKIEVSIGHTRKCLQILSKSDCKIQIITKGDIVTRDVDLLLDVPSTVALTVITDDDSIAKILEPEAPSPTQRISAAQNLIKKGIPVSVRIDPIIPFVNDNQEKLVAALSSIGVTHITSSTYKVKPDNWRRLCTALPKAAEKLKPLYFQQGEKVGGNMLLPRDLRFKLLKNIRDLADLHGIKFGVCREGIPKLNTASCDGSWLIHKKRLEA